jgi:hypothetical protein
MKIIITEKQADKLFNQKVVCKKCNHSWKIEKNDKLPFLCHMCGWNQELKKYQDDELLKFWRKELN